uniref:EB domain-containing protein n=1 Tax=Steinernema glaseri TaxID=37863 RepID=A0A1I8ABM0_9BILA
QPMGQPCFGANCGPQIVLQPCVGIGCGALPLPQRPVFAPQPCVGSNCARSPYLFGRVGCPAPRAQMGPQCIPCAGRFFISKFIGCSAQPVPQPCVGVNCAPTFQNVQPPCIGTSCPPIFKKLTTKS